MLKFQLRPHQRALQARRRSRVADQVVGGLQCILIQRSGGRDAQVVIALAAHVLHRDRRAEEHHVILQVGQRLLWVIDRCRGHAEHLVVPCPTYRIDAAEAATVAEGQLGRVSAWAQVLGHLQLALAPDHLKLDLLPPLDF